MFKRFGMHFTRLNFNSLLPKIMEIRHVAELIGISEIKLDGSGLRKEIVIVGYDLVRIDRSRKGGGGASFIKHSFAYRIDLKTKST